MFGCMAMDPTRSDAHALLAQARETQTVALNALLRASKAWGEAHGDDANARALERVSAAYTAYLTARANVQRCGRVVSALAALEFIQRCIRTRAEGPGRWNHGRYEGWQACLAELVRYLDEAKKRATIFT